MSTDTQVKVMSAKIRPMTENEKESKTPRSNQCWGDYGNMVVEAELSDGSTNIIHKYFGDEHVFLPYEFEGKSLAKVREYIHEKYVEYFQS